MSELHTNEKYFLTTRRLGFGKWREDALPLAWCIWGDSKVTKLIDTRGRFTESEVKDRLLEELTNDKKYNVQYWPVFLLETGDIVGCCGLRPYASKENVYEIGFHIRSKHWRLGYASEAAEAVINLAFTELKVSALFAGHHPNNTASKKLLAKLGFVYTHDEYYPHTGLNHPSYLLESKD